MLTFVIPTRNRPQFIERALAYYSIQKLQYKIFIVDSSDPEQLDQDKTIYDRFQHKLNIYYRVFAPSNSFADKLLAALSQVDTPFTVIAADDDFLIPKTLQSAVEFLESHPGYSVVSGEAFNFGIKNQGYYGQIDKFESYPQRSLEMAKASERLESHLSYYTTTFYSVHRTEQLLHNRKLITESRLDYRFDELLDSALSVTQGKVKKLDRLSMLRQGWISQTARDPLRLDFFDWLTNIRWADQYHKFVKILGDSLIEQGDLNQKTAPMFVKKQLGNYIVNNLVRGASLQDNLDRQRCANTPFKRKVIRIIEKMFLPGENLYFNELITSPRSLLFKLKSIYQIHSLFPPNLNDNVSQLDWIAKPFWAKLYRQVLDSQTNAICCKTGYPIEQVQQEIKHAIWVYMAAWLNKFHVQNNQYRESSFHEELSLSEILDPSHEYADDFRIFYELVTQRMPLTP